MIDILTHFPCREGEGLLEEPRELTASAAMLNLLLPSRLRAAVQAGRQRSSLGGADG